MENNNRLFLELLILSILTILVALFVGFIIYDGQKLTTETHTRFDGGKTYSTYKKNKLISEISYDTNGELYSKDEYEYDNRGNRILSKHYYVLEDIQYSYTWESKYDVEDKLMTHSQYNHQGELEQQDSYHYTEQGYTRLYVEYDNEQRIIRQEKYSNTNGIENIIEAISFNPDGSVSSIEDSCGVSEKTLYKDDSSIDWYMKYTYDKDCNKVRQQWYHSLTDLTKITRYNLKGDITDSAEYKGLR